MLQKCTHNVGSFHGQHIQGLTMPRVTQKKEKKTAMTDRMVSDATCSATKKYFTARFRNTWHCFHL